ncbi:MAG: tetratricopeptide repeat protein, partial [Candidatus Acidiferrales bacterium]
IQPANAEVWTKLGVCLRQTGDTPGAIAAFTRAVASAPDFLVARKYLAEALAQSGRTDESTAQLNTILARNPHYEHADEVYYALGLNLEKKGDQAEAARDYEQALLANPNFADAQKHLQALREGAGKNRSR